MSAIRVEEVTKVFRHRPALFNWMGREARGETRALYEVSLAAQAGNLTGAAVFVSSGQSWQREELYLVDTRAGIDFFAGIALSRAPDLSYFF